MSTRSKLGRRRSWTDWMCDSMKHTISNHPESVEASVSMPRLSDYYDSPAATPTSFIRKVREAVRAARADRREPPSFDAEDLEETLGRLMELDPTLSKTARLLGKEPQQVRQWVTQATRAAIDKWARDLCYVGEPALARFDRFLQSSAGDFLGRDKERRERAQNLLRLSLPWLVEKQNLKPEEALPLVGRAKRSRAKTTDLRRAVQRLLFKVPLLQLMNLSLVSAFYTRALADEVYARQNALRELSRCQDIQAAQMAEMNDVRCKLRRVEKEREKLLKLLTETEGQLRGQKELRAIDRTQMRGRSRRFLKERLSPLISDARDAMEFDPPQIEGAQQRLNMVAAAIAKELDKPDE